MEEIKERIKTVLDIKDTLQDDVLDIFIDNVTKHLFSKLRKVNKEIEEVPGELDYIIEEIVIRRYNRIGTEGMKSESVEGHRVDFYELEKDFTPYEDIIDGYADEEQGNAKRGRVLFI